MWWWWTVLLAFVVPVYGIHMWPECHIFPSYMANDPNVIRYQEEIRQECQCTVANGTISYVSSIKCALEIITEPILLDRLHKHDSVDWVYIEHAYVVDQFREAFAPTLYAKEVREYIKNIPYVKKLQTQVNNMCAQYGLQPLDRCIDTGGLVLLLSILIGLPSLSLFHYVFGK